jgi:hypothetical protein
MKQSEIEERGETKKTLQFASLSILLQPLMTHSLVTALADWISQIFLLLTAHSNNNWQFL